IPVFVRAGIDEMVPATDSLGNVTTVALPRFAQFSGQCGQFGSNTNVMSQEIRDNYGFECQGTRRPMDWSSSAQLQSKLQYTYGSGSSVSLTGIASGDQQRFTPGTSLNNTSIYRGTHNSNRLAILNLTHQVS